MTEAQTTQVESKPMEIVQYNQVRADIEAMKAKNASLVFKYDTRDGNKNARSHIAKLRSTKADVERARKDAKAYALEYGRKVDGIAKELTAEVEAMIDVHQRPIDEIEQREKARVDAITSKIQAMRQAAELTDGLTSADLLARLEPISKTIITQDVYQEFASDATSAQQYAVETLTRKLAEAQKREAEQAELARLRQEAEENAKRQREEQIARDAADRARIEAEAKAKAEQDAARKREQEAVEAERRALQAAREATERAERERVENERRAAEAAARAKAEQEAAVIRAREDEARRQQQQREAEARAAAERAKNQRVRELVIAEVAESIMGIITQFNDGDARLLAAAMIDGKIVRVTIDTSNVKES